MIEAMMKAAEPGASHGDVMAAGLQVVVPAGGALNIERHVYEKQVFVIEDVDDLWFA